MPTSAIEIRQRKPVAIFVRLNDGRARLDCRVDVGRVLAERASSFDRICRQVESQQ
jgi:hypothetical protein